MVLDPDSGRCARKEAKPKRRWAQGGVPTRMLGPGRGRHKGGGLGDLTLVGKGNGVLVRTLGPERGWIVRSHVGWGGNSEDIGPRKRVDCEIPHRLGRK